MIALDTNVLARYLLADDVEQSAAASRLLAGGRACTAPLTVFLELVWVLEAQDIAREDIVRGLHTLLGLAHFKPRSAPVLAQALTWYAQQMDFADALHLAQSRDDEQFASFDLRLAKRAAKLAARPAVVKPA